MNQEERRKNGCLYDPYYVPDKDREQTGELLERYNRAYTRAMRKALEPELFALLGSCGEHVTITPPFYCTYIGHIFIGDDFYANTQWMVIANGEVHIGNRVQIGPRVTVVTPVHPLDSGLRATGLEKALPVVIGDDVWIAANVTVNPGVTIGDRSVIASGAVVTRDIPADSLAAGVPARVIRKIGEEDRQKLLEEYNAYLQDPDI